MTTSDARSDAAVAPLARTRASDALSAFVALTKPKQTGLLMATGIGAYLMSAVPVEWVSFTVGMFALAAAISGSTALNMVIDSDIDARMSRTAARPIPSGLVSRRVALIFGLLLSVAGVAVAFAVRSLFGLTVLVGLVFDVVVYSLWLKRRTPFSILVGGISGGMPAIASRALAIGRIDLVGVLLGAGVVLWIPAHILTLAMRYADEYEQARVPVWPRVFGEKSTRRLIAVATAGAVVVLVSAGVLIEVHPLALAALVAAGVVLAGTAAVALIKPSERTNWLLFKGASVFMLLAFVCLTVGIVVQRVCASVPS